MNGSTVTPENDQTRGVAPSSDASDAGGIELVGVTRTFDGTKTVVRDLSLRIGEGEFFSLIGPSGCGKTTTLRMIGGLDEPTSGSIHLRGRDITHVPSHRRPVHTVFQNYALFPHLTVFQNIAFGLRERHAPRAEITERVRAMIELVELGGREKAKPGELSGGMQQRVALARSLVLEPQALLLDEPLGALDLKLRRQMQHVLKRIQREVGVTFVYVTHDQEEAFSMSDRVGVMSDGDLVQVDTPTGIYDHPRTTGVAQFVGSSNLIPCRVSAAGGDGVTVVWDSLAVPTPAPTLDAVPGLAVGDDAMAMIRPECIDIDVAPHPARPSLTGTVTDISFLGSQTAATIRHPAGTIIAHVSRRTALRGAGVGDTVEVSWRPEDMWVTRP